MPLDYSRKDTASRAVGATYVLSVIIAVGSLAKDWNCVRRATIFDGVVFRIGDGHAT